MVAELRRTANVSQPRQEIQAICMHCPRTLSERQTWKVPETPVRERTDVRVSHGLCPECREEHYPRIGSSSGGERAS